MIKIILMLISIMFSFNINALSCSKSSIEKYILNKHILKGKLVNKVEIEEDIFIKQYFLIEPIHFFTEKTNEKLIVSNKISKINHKNVYDINYDVNLDMEKEYYFFVNKDTNMIEIVNWCSGGIVTSDELFMNSLEYKAISFFNNNKLELPKNEFYFPVFEIN